MTFGDFFESVEVCDLVFMSYVLSLDNATESDSILTIVLKQLQIMVEDCVMMLKKQVGANMVNTYMTKIQSFFETNYVKLIWKKIRRLYSAKIIKGYIRRSCCMM